MMFLNVMLAGLIWLEIAARPALLVALGVLCVFVALMVSFAASRGKLHIPGYVGLAFGAFAVALILGRISGAHGVRGSTSGVVLSILFFLLIAAAVGSVLAVFFYREPPET
jgi:hypothetical protein